MSDILLQQIEKIPLVQLNKDLFRAVCHMELEFRNTEGTLVNPPISKINPTISNNSIKNKIADIHKSCPRHPLPNHGLFNCPQIKHEILHTACETQEPQIYICPAGLTLIVIPIIMNTEVIGVMYTGENDTFRFAPNQVSAVIKQLNEFIHYITQNEIHPMILNIYSGNAITRQKELLQRVVDYIKRNYHNNNLTLQDVAKQNSVSYHYLSRLFKKELNTTFAQFRSRIRLDAAEKMLKDNRMTVSQISYACGFEDPGYFCKVFRNNLGTSPLSFRSTKLTVNVKKFQQLDK